MLFIFGGEDENENLFRNIGDVCGIVCLERGTCAMKLCDTNVGDMVIVRTLGECDIRRRLLDIGLVENTVVECVGKSPLGDPHAYLIRGAVIALRRKDCENILVEVCYE